MRIDDMPSVEDTREDDWVLPDSELEWNEWWLMNTLTAKGLFHWQRMGGRELPAFSQSQRNEERSAA